MSYKHIQEYYQLVKGQYFDLLSELEDFSKEAEEGLIDPDRLEAVKETLQPLKLNYERWSYMMYLLHQPVKKSKQKRYIAQNKKFIARFDKSNSVQEVLNENAAVLEKVKNR